MFKHYTYIHRCKDDISRIFYVGKGSGNRVNSDFHRSKHWKSIVAKHGIITEKVAFWETHQQALEHEKFLIFCFRSMGIKLCNQTDGGDGVTGYVPSQEQRKKLSERMKNFVFSEEAKAKISIANLGNKYRLGHKNSEKHKAIIASIWKGKKLSEEHKKKLSLAKIGKKRSDETKRKISEAHQRRKENASRNYQLFPS
jgi:hypothetical protein